MKGFCLFNCGTDGAVDGVGCILLSIYFLLVFGVDEGVMAVLADENFVRHYCRQ